MTELLTAAQMRAIEAAAISSGEVTGLELMERAGCGVVDAIFEEWPDLRTSSYRAVVLCGPGNNGGDGFVVARLLKEWGWEVEVFALGRLDGIAGDALSCYEGYSNTGGQTKNLQDHTFSFKADVVIDAVFGTGLSRPIPTSLSDLFASLSSSATEHENTQRIVSVDIPSGVCADSGRFLRECHEAQELRADLTVTFHSKKAGHLLADGPRLCGKVVVVDIGITSPSQSKLEESDDSCLHWLPKTADSHKFSYGHALILAGDEVSGGAARLAARGALRIGAGLVSLGCPPTAVTANAAQLNAIMIKPIADAIALQQVLQDTRINTLCIGPGLGIERADALLRVVFSQKSESRRSLVLDADALTALAQSPELFAKLPHDCVLTPHAGEFARLFPDIAAKLAEPAIKGPAYSKVDAALSAAARAGCIIVFKGADTVIAEPWGSAYVHSAGYDRAAPWLATAGSGDVLAGFITGLLARGLAPMQAAETAAWLHVECARSFGPGLIAEDLPEELPKVFRALGLS